MLGLWFLQASFRFLDPAKRETVARRVFLISISYLPLLMEALVADRMGIAEISPEWIGANLVLDGIPHLSMLPAGALLFFKNGATVKVDAQNGPCRIAGKQGALRAGLADIEGGALLFPKAAKRLRGLVAWVEKPGRLALGEEVSVRVPEQWIYRPAPSAG